MTPMIRCCALLVLVSQLLLLTGAKNAWAQEQPRRAASRTPVILDTDIGDDIDDTWALALLLKSPELDVKLVVGDYGKGIYRAKLLARFLTVAGRTDIPVGVGLKPEDVTGSQSAWIKGYDLKSYPGKVYQDGVQAIIDTILASPRPVTLICIGPAPNIAEALRRRPGIVRNARLVGMYGSVRRGYDGSKEVAAEWNVKADPAACRAALTAGWDVTITPLDTCGVVQLRGKRFERVRNSKDPIAAAVIENYRLWLAAQKRESSTLTASSTLFDTVAAYLAVSQNLLKMEDLRLKVADDGKTVLDNQGKKMHVATEWTDQDAFEELLVRRLTGP
jgi:inosine-uridine nucleoside N-ribohydrolase